MTGHYRLRLFGGFQLIAADGATIPVPRRKGTALLAYLGASISMSSARETLASLLWGQSEQRLARQSLRQALQHLGKDLAAAGAGILRFDGQAVGLDTGRVDVDAAEFEALIATKSVTSLAEAATLYTGEFLAGLSTDAPDFEDWLANSRGHYRDLALRGLVDLIEHRRAAGQLDLAAQTANQALRIDPYREDIHRWLMRLHAARGLRAAALAQYRECESILRRELGVSPDDETVRLHERLLARREQPTLTATVKAELARNRASDNARPFVGREAEQGELAQCAVRASEQGARLAVISGESGIGKSRLIDEFVNSPALQSWSVIRIRARATERPLAFGLWAELLNSRALEGSEGPAVSQSLARRLAFVRGGPGAWDRRGRGEAVDHPYVFDAMVELIHSRAAAASLLLVIEDLHFADSSSQHLLSYVVRNLRQAPVLVVASIRQDSVAPLPDAMRDLEQDCLIDRITLRLLARGKAVDLVRALRQGSGDQPVPRSRLREIWYLSDGNPRLIEEALGQADDSKAIPAALRAELSQCLKNSDETAQKLAVIACVIGDRFSHELLCLAAGLTESETVRGVESLIACGLFEARGQELMFARRRLRHGLYFGLLPASRRRLHEVVARALQNQPVNAPEVHFGTLVHHFLAAGCVSDAQRCQLQLGQAHAQHGNYLAAKKAFTLVLDMGSNSATARLSEIDAHLGLAAIAEATGQSAVALTELRTVAAGGAGLLDVHRRIALLVARGRLNCVLGNDDFAYDYTRRAVNEAVRNCVRGFWWAPDRMLERIHRIGSGVYEIIAEATEARNLARRRRSHFDEASAASVLAVLLALSDKFDLAQGQVRAAIGAAKHLGDPRILALVWQVGGIVRTWADDASGALEEFERAAEMAEVSGALVRHYLIRGHRGHALALAGRPAEGVGEIESALAMGKRLDLRLSRPLFEACRASALLDIGDVAAAMSAGRAALRSATAANQPWPRSIALRSLARAMAHPDVRDLAGANWAIKAALAEQTSLGLDFERRRTLATCGEIQTASGDLQRYSRPAARAQEVFQQVRGVLNREATQALAKTLCTPCTAR